MVGAQIIIVQFSKFFDRGSSKFPGEMVRDGDQNFILALGTGDGGGGMGDETLTRGTKFPS